MSKDRSLLGAEQPPAGEPYDMGEPLRRRVLLTAAADALVRLEHAFAGDLLRPWEVHFARTFEQARFRMQHESWDALLLDESVLPWHDPQGLAWLASQRDVPALLLTTPDPDLIARALEGGVQQWLPRDLVLQYPSVLAAALGQAAGLADHWRACRAAGLELRDSRRQISRLINRLWDSATADAHARWHSQRYLLERLQEEVVRADRYSHVVSVALGEVQPTANATAEPDQLSDWAAEQITRAKRRCDLAGQYGPHGFLLILTHTAEPGAVQCCHRLRGLLENAAASVPVRALFGVAGYATDAATPKALLSRAEARLEQEKGRSPA